MANVCTGKFYRLIPLWGIKSCCQTLTGAVSKYCRISLIDPSIQKWNYKAVRDKLKLRGKNSTL